MIVIPVCEIPFEEEDRSECEFDEILKESSTNEKLRSVIGGDCWAVVTNKMGEGKKLRYEA